MCAPMVKGTTVGSDVADNKVVVLDCTVCRRSRLFGMLLYDISVTFGAERGQDPLEQLIKFILGERPSRISREVMICDRRTTAITPDLPAPKNHTRTPHRRLTHRHAGRPLTILPALVTDHYGSEPTPPHVTPNRT